MANTFLERMQEPVEYRKLLAEEVRRMDVGEPRLHPGIPDPRFELQAMNDLINLIMSKGFDSGLR